MTPDDAQEARAMLAEFIAATNMEAEMGMLTAAEDALRTRARAFLARTSPREPWTAEKEREAERIFDESCGRRT